MLTRTMSNLVLPLEEVNFVLLLFSGEKMFLIEKLSELLTAARQYALQKMDRIVEASLSEEDCIVRMKHEVDEFTAEFISKDDFFSNFVIIFSPVEIEKKASKCF